MQLLRLLAPDCGLYDPEEHEEHSATVEEPTTSENVPGVQGMHSFGLTCPTVLLLQKPAGQPMQNELPLEFENILAVQFRQVELEVTEEYIPAGHWVHRELPLVEIYDPGRHTVQLDFEKEPGFNVECK
jgi:hypothetical protein